MDRVAHASLAAVSFLTPALTSDPRIAQRAVGGMRVNPC
jgi:hypothetical protein